MPKGRKNESDDENDIDKILEEQVSLPPPPPLVVMPLPETNVTYTNANGTADNADPKGMASPSSTAFKDGANMMSAAEASAIRTTIKLADGTEVTQMIPKNTTLPPPPPLSADTDPTPTTAVSPPSPTTNTNKSKSKSKSKNKTKANASKRRRKFGDGVGDDDDDFTEPKKRRRRRNNDDDDFHLPDDDNGDDDGDDNVKSNNNGGTKQVGGRGKRTAAAIAEATISAIAETYYESRPRKQRSNKQQQQQRQQQRQQRNQEAPSTVKPSSPPPQLPSPAQLLSSPPPPPPQLSSSPSQQPPPPPSQLSSPPQLPPLSQLSSPSQQPPSSSQLSSPSQQLPPPAELLSPPPPPPQLSSPPSQQQLPSQLSSPAPSSQLPPQLPPLQPPPPPLMAQAIPYKVQQGKMQFQVQAGGNVPGNSTLFFPKLQGFGGFPMGGFAPYLVRAPIQVPRYGGVTPLTVPAVAVLPGVGRPIVKMQNNMPPARLRMITGQGIIELQPIRYVLQGKTTQNGMPMNIGTQPLPYSFLPGQTFINHGPLQPHFKYQQETNATLQPQVVPSSTEEHKSPQENKGPEEEREEGEKEIEGGEKEVEEREEGEKEEKEIEEGEIEIEIEKGDNNNNNDDGIVNNNNNDNNDNNDKEERVNNNINNNDDNNDKEERDNNNTNDNNNDNNDNNNDIQLPNNTNEDNNHDVVMNKNDDDNVVPASGEENADLANTNVDNTNDDNKDDGDKANDDNDTIGQKDTPVTQNAGDAHTNETLSTNTQPPQVMGGGGGTMPPMMLPGQYRVLGTPYPVMAIQLKGQPNGMNPRFVLANTVPQQFFQAVPSQVPAGIAQTPQNMNFPRNTVFLIPQQFHPAAQMPPPPPPSSSSSSSTSNQGFLPQQVPPIFASNVTANPAAPAQPHLPPQQTQAVPRFYGTPAQNMQYMMPNTMYQMPSSFDDTENSREEPRPSPPTAEEGNAARTPSQRVEEVASKRGPKVKYIDDVAVRKVLADNVSPSLTATIYALYKQRVPSETIQLQAAASIIPTDKMKAPPGLKLPKLLIKASKLLAKQPLSLPELSELQKMRLFKPNAYSSGTVINDSDDENGGFSFNNIINHNNGVIHGAGGGNIGVDPANNDNYSIFDDIINNNNMYDYNTDPINNINMYDEFSSTTNINIDDSDDDFIRNNYGSDDDDDDDDATGGYNGDAAVSNVPAIVDNTGPITVTTSLTGEDYSYYYYHYSDDEDYEDNGIKGSTLVSDTNKITLEMLRDPNILRVTKQKTPEISQAVAKRIIYKCKVLMSEKTKALVMLLEEIKTNRSRENQGTISVDGKVLDTTSICKIKRPRGRPRKTEAQIQQDRLKKLSMAQQSKDTGDQKKRRRGRVGRPRKQRDPEVQTGQLGMAGEPNTYQAGIEGNPPQSGIIRMQLPLEPEVPSTTKRRSRKRYSTSPPYGYGNSLGSLSSFPSMYTLHRSSSASSSPSSSPSRMTTDSEEEDNERAETATSSSSSPSNSPSLSSSPPLAFSDPSLHPFGIRSEGSPGYGGLLGQAHGNSFVRKTKKGRRMVRNAAENGDEMGLTDRPRISLYDDDTNRLRLSDDNSSEMSGSSSSEESSSQSPAQSPRPSTLLPPESGEAPPPPSQRLHAGHGYESYYQDSSIRDYSGNGNEEHETTHVQHLQFLDIINDEPNSTHADPSERKLRLTIQKPRKKPGPRKKTESDSRNDAGGLEFAPKKSRRGRKRKVDIEGRREQTQPDSSSIRENNSDDSFTSIESSRKLMENDVYPAPLTTVTRARRGRKRKVDSGVRREQAPQPPGSSSIRGRNSDGSFTPMKTSRKRAEKDVYSAPRTTATRARRGRKKKVDSGVRREKAKAPPPLPPSPELSSTREHSDGDYMPPKIEESKKPARKTLKLSLNILTRATRKRMEQFNREIQESQPIPPSPQLPETTSFREHSNGGDMLPPTEAPKKQTRKTLKLTLSIPTRASRRKMEEQDRKTQEKQDTSPSPQPPEITPFEEHVDDGKPPQIKVPRKRTRKTLRPPLNILTRSLRKKMEEYEREIQESQAISPSPQLPELSPIREHSDNDDGVLLPIEAPTKSTRKTLKLTLSISTRASRRKMEEHNRETQEKQDTSPSPQPPELSPLREPDDNDDDMLPQIETPASSAENGTYPDPLTAPTHVKRGSNMDVDSGVHREQTQLPPLLPPPPDLSPIREHSDDDDDDDDRLPTIETPEISTENTFEPSSDILTREAGNKMEEHDRETQEKQRPLQPPELSPIREYSDDDDDDDDDNDIFLPIETPPKSPESENNLASHIVMTRADEGKKEDNRGEYRDQIQLPPLLPPPPDLSPIREHSDDDNDEDRLPPIGAHKILTGNIFKPSSDIFTHASRNKMAEHDRETQEKQGTPQQPLQPPELSPIREYSDDDDDDDNYISHLIGIPGESPVSEINPTYTEGGRREKAEREAHEKQATLPLPQPPELSPIREHSDDDDGDDMLSSIFIYASAPRRKTHKKPVSPIISPLTSDSPSRSPSPQPIPAPLNETQVRLPLSPLSPDISPMRDDYSSSSSPLFSPFLAESRGNGEPDIELLVARPALEELSSDEEPSATHKSHKRKGWSSHNGPLERKHGMAQRDTVSQPKQKRLKLSQPEQPTIGAEDRQSVAIERITPSPNPSPPSPPIWNEQHGNKNSAANVHEEQQVSEFKLDKSMKNDSLRQPEIELLDEWSD